jgi:hypothetical protein
MIFRPEAAKCSGLSGTKSNNATMGRENRKLHIFLYIICLVSAAAFLALVSMSISRFLDYRDAVHADGVPAIISTPFEDWRANFKSGMSISHGATDSSSSMDVRTSVPNDSTLKGIFDALKTQALQSHKQRLITLALQPALVSILAITLCTALWSWLRGTSVLFLWLLVVLVPLVCAVFGSWAFWAATNREGQSFDEPGVTAWQAIWTAAPFFVLAVFASRKRNASQGSEGITWAWIFGILLTFAFWSFALYDGYAFWRVEGTGGANIGLGMLMLVSPLLIGAGMALGYHVGTKHPKAENDGHA